MPKNIPFIPLLLLLIPGFAAAQSPDTRNVAWVPDINGLAITLVKPAFPEAAVDVGADGATVTLRVVVNENGDVVSAHCSMTCHPMLKDAAELAALMSKFKPHAPDGRPTKYEGTLLYTFVVKHVNWYRFGTALESTRQFDNISLGPVAQILTSEFGTEKAKLMTLDESGVSYDKRQKVISEVIGTIKSKLKGIDLWRFEVGMALRQVTFWTQAGEKTDRAALQRALDALPGHISSAPEEVSDLVKTEIAALSKLSVTPEIPERELRAAISKLSRRIPVDLK
jgi:hypothetical protein